MVFFQAMLMLGYMYAHQLGRISLLRTGTIAHCAVVFLPLAILPIAIHNPLFASATSHPILSILGIASASIALPFFVLSSTNSVLQLWLSRTSHPRASDPYFLTLPVTPGVSSVSLRIHSQSSHCSHSRSNRDSGQPDIALSPFCSAPARCSQLGTPPLCATSPFMQARLARSRPS